MAIWMLLQVGRKLLASIAVLDGVPEGKIESISYRIRWCWRHSFGRRERGGITPRSGE
jgi:hypothetical protein